MCDFPPITVDPLENYVLDHVRSPVGQIVIAYCRNTTVAIVKCLHDLTWNSTVPSCSIKDKSNDNMSTLLIILWVIGGLLLFSLLILIIVIITTKSKTRCNLRGNGSQNTSIFHISGRGLGRGGDNPAFTRADEICGEWSYHRGDSLAVSHRLPSYHEAVLNSYISAPPRTGNANLQDLHAIGNSTSQQNNDFQQRPSTVTRSEVTQRDSTESANQSADEQVTITNQIHDSSHNTSVDQSDNNNSNNSLPSHRGNKRPNVSTSRRYVENYPQCFFENEPPPPYTPEPSSVSNQRTTHQNHQEGENGYHRNVHSLTHSQTPTHIEIMHNPNFRQSPSDRLVNAAKKETMNVSHRRQTQFLNSAQANNERTGRQFDNRTDNRSSSVTITYLSSDVIHSNCHFHDNQFLNHSNASQISDYSNENQLTQQSIVNQRHDTANRNSLIRYVSENNNHMMSVHQVPSNINNMTFLHQPSNSESGLDAFHNLPSTSASSNSNVYFSYQNYEQSDNVDNNSPNNKATGSIQNTPLPHSNYCETQPLGTSTPINQSPAEVRRFVPDKSPITKPNQSYYHHRSRQSHAVQDYGMENDQRLASVVDEQTPARQGESQFSVARIAPLARFDGDYTYL